jgi:hypothetical protein
VTPAHGAFYATYLQATRKNEGNNVTKRKQWIVIPPMTQNVINNAGGGDTEPDYRFLYFFREQSTPSSRPKWRFTKSGSTAMQVILPDEIKRLTDSNVNFAAGHQWEISPVITCQLTAREVVELYVSPQTPYALLRRFEKVAREKHNLAI